MRSDMDAIPASETLIAFLEEKTRQWYDHFPDKEEASDPKDKFHDLAIRIHYCNFFQWDREGKVRDPDLPSETIARLKREIDRSNIERNKLVEYLDEFCVSQLNIVEKDEWSDFFLNSETLGQLVDRISILILKIFFTDRYSQRTDLDMKLRNICSQRVSQLRRQLKYVSTCYDRFLSHLRKGTGYMLMYKQFKIYEDQDLTR